MKDDLLFEERARNVTTFMSCACQSHRVTGKGISCCMGMGKGIAGFRRILTGLQSIDFHPADLVEFPALRAFPFSNFSNP